MRPSALLSLLLLLLAGSAGSVAQPTPADGMPDRIVSGWMW